MNQSASTAREDHVPATIEKRIVALESIEELRGLSHEEFEWIATSGSERHVEDGELIFSQAQPPQHLIFILAGEVTIKRHSSSPVTVFSGRSGRITGKTPFSRAGAWNADGRASGEVWLLELHESQFPALLSAIPSMTERMVWVLIDRNREYTRAEEQIGKLAALSKLAGNLAHELNNPASAARRAVSTLIEGSATTRMDVRYEIGVRLSDQVALDRYLEGISAVRVRVASSLRHSGSMLTAELEERLSDWLRDNGFEEGWKLAPILAEAEISISQLQEFLAPLPIQIHQLALRDLLVTVSHDAAIASVIQATEQIFRIVAAVKDYSYMDRQPLQEVNIPSALDSVLIMFEARLKNVVIRKNIAPELPLFHGFGSELNQALAALIENSLDAMEDEGMLTLSVKLQGNTFLIEVEDDGRGIPEDCQDRIFEPFFTTKPLGKGLGLGLDTVQRVVAKHFGAVAFDTSERGTVFHVRLPVNRVGVY